MNKFMKISAAAASILAGGMLLAPAALADATCTITDNGARSHNTCNITIRGGHSSNPCEQSCDPCSCQGVGRVSIRNRVKVWSNTGGNQANANTGGNVSITTGDSNVNVTITNTVNP